MFLPIDCTVQDVIDATTEQIYYSFERGLDEYSDDVVSEMAAQLTLRGL